MSEHSLDRRERRRLSAEARIYDALGRRLDAADALIGVMISEGETVHYINVRSTSGKLTGRTRKFVSKSDAQAFLIRNKYV